jgi:uncharacterized protein involved in exopolysaccharide biosynthesis
VKNRLFAPPSVDDLMRLLQAWRFWVLSGLVGALLGGAVYFVSPPDFRARATVVVDFNMEAGMASGLGSRVVLLSRTGSSQAGGGGLVG